MTEPEKYSAVGHGKVVMQYAASAVRVVVANLCDGVDAPAPPDFPGKHTPALFTVDGDNTDTLLNTLGHKRLLNTCSTKIIVFLVG